MKYFIVGLQGSGKHEVLDILEHQGVACGRMFSTIENPSEEIYNSYNYELYTPQDVEEIFENNAYVFMREIKVNKEKFYEGLSKYSLDQNDVFVMSPDQLVCISPNLMPKDVCYVWMDNTKVNRLNRFRDEKCGYDFNKQEKEESRDVDSFIRIMHQGDDHILYFTNEEPVRIAAIIFALIQHPDLTQAFTQAFNS